MQHAPQAARERRTAGPPPGLAERDLNKHIYIYIYREREREGEREIDR